MALLHSLPTAQTLVFIRKVALQQKRKDAMLRWAREECVSRSERRFVETGQLPCHMTLCITAKHVFTAILMLCRTVFFTAA